MLYLGIDQHGKHLTVSIRNSQGEVVLRRQVSTRWGKVRAFFDELLLLVSQQGAKGFAACVEVCGFNDWLIALLREYGCQRVVLVQPEQRSKRKTDRRDAHRLSELLWLNRQQIALGRRIRGVREVRIASPDEQHDRQLTTLHQRLTKDRTKIINRLKHLLRKHNLQHDCPTKTFQTQACRRWLAQLQLPAIDRLERDHLLAQWKQLEEQLSQVQIEVRQRAADNPRAQIIGTITGRAGFCALALAARIGPIENFPRPRSLANYWGLTPSSNNTGEATQRLGSITKQGSPLARWVLGQLVLHVLRRDPWMRNWYQRIKRRRGAKIARVAVMRRLATIIWHMVKYNEPYLAGGPPRLRKQQAA